MRTSQQSLFQRLILPTIVLFSLICAWSAADAALVSYSFTGGVTNVSNALKPTLGISTIAGTFTFDNSPATGGIYPGVVSGLNVNVGGYTATYVSGLVNGVSIEKGVSLLDGSTGDNWKLATSATGMPVNGYALRVFDLDLEREGSLFANTDMQNPPSIGDLTGTRWRLIFENAMGVVRIQGNVLSLTAVPLPAAVLLFGAGVISLIGLGAGGTRNFRGTQA